VKRFLLVILLVGGAMVGGSYYLTGRLPWVALSAEEQQVAALRDELGQIQQQWRQAGKTQALGVDASSLSEDVPARLDRLDQAVADLLPRLKTVEARNQATFLRHDIANFRSEMH
jgi:hypothetical protein